jgi:predicted deacylase
MKWSDFDLASIPRGRKARLSLDVAADGSLPVLVGRGRGEGRRLVVSAGVHGDEYEGMRAIHEIFDELDPAEMSGDLLAVPCANPAAFWNGTNTSPSDGKNLARVFPGDPAGTLTPQLAHAFGQKIIRGADLYVDLHSGGTRYSMPSMVGYCSADERSRRAAEVFGAPVIWSHPTVAAGRTVSFAHEQGIPWLYTEARGAGRIHPEDLGMKKRGIVNLLRHLGILPGAPEPGPQPLRLAGAGDTDQGLASTQAGFLHNHVQILEMVTANQLLGRLVDLSGELLEEYRAPGHGVIGLVHELPLVRAGEPLFLLAKEEGS